MGNIITLCFLFFTVVSFAQKPKNGVYVFKYYDLEYSKFHGTCKVIVKDDSVKVIALEDCHRASGQLIDEGILQKNNNKSRSIHSGNWQINTGNIVDDTLSSLDFKKKIYYTP